jgi:hypothetical protein
MLSEVGFKYDEKATKELFRQVDLAATMESRICIVSGCIEFQKKKGAHF